MIRPATPTDYSAIRALVAAAFGQPDEADLVERLRADREVLVELVAKEEGVLTGHILYSRLAIVRPDETLSAAALAPVAVAPAHQRQGIGAALIRAGNAACAKLGLAAIIVLGHSHYYPRFGFSAETAESLDAPFSGPAFMALELAPDRLRGGGRVIYAPAFGALS
jgi:putative acetyltransferase